MNERALDRLFRRFRDRHDGAALAAVFDATARELLDVACHLQRDPAQAEDLVQATFVAAIRGAARYDGSSPVKAWLYGILWREAARARRDAARAVDPLRLTPRREPEPIEALLARELPEAVDAALARVPRRYREVLEPLLRDGRPAGEIAMALKRSPGTVRSQIHRGLELLRRALPGGLAPASGLFVPPRGLEALRGEVLKAAGFPPGVAAAAPALAFGVSTGAFLMSKATLLGGTAALIAAAAVWLAHGLSTSAPDAGARGAAPDGLLARAEPVPSVPAAEERGAPARTAAPAAEPAAPTAGSTGAPADPAGALARWLARFNEAPDDWRHGWSVAAEIAELPPDEALAIMTGVWPHLSVAVKEQVLKPFVFDGGHVHALKLLDLAANDAALSVQGRAFTYLQAYAFCDFSTDYEAYRAWAARTRDLPVGQVLEQNARAFVGELLALPPDELALRVRSLDGLDLRAGGPAGLDLAAVMRGAGGLQALAACLQAEDPEARRAALAWSKTLEADEAWLRTWVLPSIEDPPATEPGVLDASLDALARPECAWAQETLLDFIRRASAQEPAGEEPRLPGAASAARSLAEIGDPAAVPAMIELVVHDRSGTLAYDVGYFGLARLTGVRWHESYDGAWWLDWWDKNSGRLPPEVRGAVIRR